MNKYANLQCYHRNSYEVLEKILPEISGIKLYWLDAHFSGGNTATLRDKNGRVISPLQDEVRVILENGLEDSFILIDDICGYSYNKDDSPE